MKVYWRSGDFLLDKIVLMVRFLDMHIRRLCNLASTSPFSNLDCYWYSFVDYSPLE
jgi:hypothetical protein